jgi:hypothetical protein
MIYKFIGQLIMCLLGLAVTLVITFLVMVVELWIFYNSVAVPFGYTTDGLVGHLFAYIIVLPTTYLTLNGCIWVIEKIGKFLDKDF